MAWLCNTPVADFLPVIILGVEAGRFAFCLFFDIDSCWIFGALGLLVLDDQCGVEWEGWNMAA